MRRSIPYHPGLIERLMDSEHAMRYLKVAMNDSYESSVHALENIREAIDVKFGKRAMPDSGATEAASELSSPSARVDLPAASQPAPPVQKNSITKFLTAELSRLNSQWDLSPPDYPDGVEPQNATEANLIYCALKRLHMKSEESA